MFTDNKDFYPTKEETVKFMLSLMPKEELTKIKYILEPSAGKGDLIEGFYNSYVDITYSSYRRELGYTPSEKDKEKCIKNFNIDCIEIDNNLQLILKNKGFNLVYSDFLTYQPNRFYDLIIANFPFSEGCKHLLHAIEIQERIGGKILCIINAETIKNHYSNERKQLIQLLNKYNAKIEYKENEFKDAERKTNVEVAIIYIDIPMKDKDSLFEKKFKSDTKNIKFENFSGLVPKMNKLERLVFEYNMVINSTTELFKEQIRINKMLNGFGLNNNISLCNCEGCGRRDLTINEFINKTNMRFWEKFIQETDLQSRLPSKLRNNFTIFLQRQENISFTIENLRYFYEHLLDMIPNEYEKTVAEVFDKFTKDYNYTDNEWCKNIHYYNGFKTNKSYRIDKKVILPCYHEYFYMLPDELVDLNIIFENISGIKDNNFNSKKLINAIEDNEKNIETTHFIINSYKKGTIHIKFKNPEHVKIFNILAGKGKAWIPSDFGNKPYKDMSDEEKDIVKEFYTPEEYENQLINGQVTNYLRLT